jgi:gliding motility-associated lipoprotein GldH
MQGPVQKKIMGGNWLTLFFTIFLFSCKRIELYEKTAFIPHHQWAGTFKPSFTFNIQDTSAAYQVYFTIRHTDRYNFNNIYVNLSIQQPGADTAQSVRYDLPLGNNENGWLGSGMDDIYEHRVPLTPSGQSFYFRKAGNYTFTVQQIMREDPLEQVMNVGIRLEKK